MIQRRRRPVLIAAAVVLVVLFSSIEVVLLGSYRETGRTTAQFAYSSDTITTLANAQRDILVLRGNVATYDPRTDSPQSLALLRATLTRQLNVAHAQARGRTQLERTISAIERDLSNYDVLRRSFRGRAMGSDVAQNELVRALDLPARRIKLAFDQEEHELYGALSKTLHRGEARQALLAAGGALTMILGLIMTLILRRTVRSDFARANRILEAEVHERKVLQEQLWHQANHDSLTGLGNRLQFERSVAAALARFDAGGESVTIVYIDLDGFKGVNDGYGHAAGDVVLSTAGQRLSAIVRTGDEVARLGGDEFAVLLLGRDIDDATAVARRLVESLAEPFPVRGQHLELGGSAGLAISSGTGVTADELLLDADLAMYVAKRAGRGGFQVFEPDMRMDVSARRQLEIELERALVEDEFRLHYQPVVDLEDGSLSGVEALVRWQHPDEGLLLPGRFLQGAEDSGLINPLGDWVLDTACRQASAWHQEHGPRAPWVSVNLSPRQMASAGLVDQIEQALAAHGTPARLLVLEISERVLADQASNSAAVLARLRRLGVRLALDDFGAGHASFMQVRFLPLDILKLDRAFIESVDSDNSARVLAESVLHLACGIGATAVAEGIETEAQAKVLRALGFHMGQGFHLGRPAEVAIIDALLAVAPATPVSAVS